MTEQRTEQRGETRMGSPNSAPTALRTAAATGPWAGWVRFGGVVMAIVGVFGVIEGLVALLTPTYYVAANGTLLVLTFSAWGWVHIILGALVAAVGASLLGTAPAWARAAGIALVSLSVLLHLAFIATAPIWSIIVIALDVVVLYALVTTWDERLDRAS